MDITDVAAFELAVDVASLLVGAALFCCGC